MDTSGLASWEQAWQQMERGSLEDIGVINQRAGVREETWSMLNLKPLQFPKTTIYSVKRVPRSSISRPISSELWASSVQQWPRYSYAKAVIAGVQRELPVYRRRDEEDDEGLD